jgi:hypothetical protein
VPAAIPVTVPLTEPTVAIPVLELLHTPPVVALVSVVVAPAHTVLDPAIADALPTLTLLKDKLKPQVLLTPYIMAATPLEIPVTRPTELTVATEGLLENHIPPGVAQDIEAVAPVHNADAPVTGATTGTSLTTTVAVA